MRTRELTQRQLSVLDLIRSFVAEHGYPPTRIEIQKHFGWKSANSAQDILKALKRKGVIEVQKRCARGIRIYAQEDLNHGPDLSKKDPNGV